jgi:hypothetical protein
MRKLCLGFLMTVPLIGMQSAPARACSCAPDSSVELARTKADVVFAGTVEEVTPVDSSIGTPRMVLRFKVARVWKGDVHESFAMHTHIGSGTCSGIFREMADPGEVLLVYGQGRPAKEWKEWGVQLLNQVIRQDLIDAVPDDLTVFTTSICTRTRLVLHADEDFRLLGAARELGPLGAQPDPAMNGKFPAKPNGLPERCGHYTDGHNWKAMASPPANAAALLDRFETWPDNASAQKSSGATYTDYWVRAPWSGIVGLCRLAGDPGLKCGEARVAFHNSGDIARMRIYGDIESVCNPVKRKR